MSVEGAEREALRKIVAWDDAEKPHKNLPLSDCADLARAALASTGQDTGEREDLEWPAAASEGEVEAIAGVVRRAWLTDAEGIASREDEARGIALDCLRRLRRVH